MDSQYKGRVALDTLGCKLNQAETEKLARQLAEVGYQLVPPTDGADVYILNTCTVTHIADRKARRRLRLAHRRNPNALVVATGCYAQRAPQELASIEGVSLVIGNSEKRHLPRLVAESSHITKSVLAQDSHCRTRCLIKVQDGCHSPCAYCIVPLVRGEEESLSSDQIVAEVRKRTGDGSKEVVLTGTKIGSYHYNGVNLPGLLEKLLSETIVARVRLSSLQPQEISPQLIALWQDRRLCRHFHLPLQSGSDGVLKRMRRHYTTADYRRAVATIRALVPDVAITTDVIVGFPGETDEEFEESYELCRQMDLARIHVFPYSPRPGTEAANMPSQVGDRVKQERNQKMLALARESITNFSQKFLGKTMMVLWEKQSGNRVWSGLSDNYIKVYTRSNRDLSNRLLPVKLTKVGDDGVWGEVMAKTISGTS